MKNGGPREGARPCERLACGIARLPARRWGWSGAGVRGQRSPAGGWGGRGHQRPDADERTATEPPRGGARGRRPAAPRVAPSPGGSAQPASLEVHATPTRELRESHRLPVGGVRARVCDWPGHALH